MIDFTAPGTDQCNTGQFMVALDVARFLPPEIFAAEMDRHLEELRSSARLPGVDIIRHPGEERRRRKEDRSKNGVLLAAQVIKQLDEMAANLKVKALSARVS